MPQRKKMRVCVGGGGGGDWARERSMPLCRAEGGKNNMKWEDSKGRPQWCALE